MDLNVDSVFVAHVKQGYEDRKAFMDAQLRRGKIDFEYMLDGDIPDIDEKVLDAYFTGRMRAATPETSCALKHVLIYKQIIRDNVRDALILEDDVVLSDNFIPVFNRAIDELKNTNGNPLRYISFENSGLEFVSARVSDRGRLLYPATAPRCTGAYYITRELAEYFYQKICDGRMGLPIDWWQKQTFEEGGIEVLWCHPPIAEQGSKNGRFTSSIQDKKRKGILRRLSWQVQKFYKMRIYSHLRKNS